MALTGFVQAAIAAQKRQVSPPVSHTRERERIALTENGQLWSERDGPANCTCGDTKFDLTGRGNPLEAPDGHLWGPAPSVAAVRFQGLTASNGAVLAWTEKELYGWGCGQTLNLRDREALFLPTVLWRLDELDDDSIMHVEFVDRATIIITQRGTQVPLPVGIRPVSVALRAYSADTCVLAEDGRCFEFDGTIKAILKPSHAYYDEYHGQGGFVQLYMQKRSVQHKRNPPTGGVRHNREGGYADYQVGMCYISPSQLTVAARGARTVALAEPRGRRWKK
ncbi:unnamed protein product [Symbiodinium natans]|uniref:Uncharacterized protein n=1 Tax=Symbiodinium natans TaxID=878477 RepID=A0A812SZY8_9DINO|nr:unnamed protein product [Symbiodinium natans]